MRVLHVEPLRYDEPSRRTIEAIARVDYCECNDQAAFLTALAGAPYEAVFVRLGLAVDARALEAAPSLRFVITPTTGLDHLELAELERRGVRVISLRGETALLEEVSSTAEHTFALLLALARKLPAAHADVLAGHWRREPFLAAELGGKTLGIVGCGRLGRKVARYALAFGMEVLAHDLSAISIARAPAGTQGASLEVLLARSHVVSLHLPLEPRTLAYLSRERFALMRDGALLVNTARGELIDERALLEALEQGKLAGAALDVLAGDSRWDERGPPADHALIAYAARHENLIITPHVGGYGRESIEKTRRFVAERFAALIRAEGEN